jgi:DNA helicase II / ATP-dependent DNA helicase PcrA
VDSQWDEAVAYGGGRLVVVGVSGAGKTRLIEERFTRLVNRGVAPERIAVVAASPARAAALRARIEIDLNQGYEQLCVGSPVEVASLILGGDNLQSLLGAGDRLAMLLERIDELSLAHHDFGGSASGLLGRFVRRIDRLKEESIGAEEFAAWADDLGDGAEGSSEREFAEVYRTHERMLAVLAARDQGDLLRDALKLVRSRPPLFEHALVDDGQELGFAAASLVDGLAEHDLTVVGDPGAALLRLRSAGAERMGSFAAAPGTRVITLESSRRCPARVLRAARVVLGREPGPGEGSSARPAGEDGGGEVSGGEVSSREDGGGEVSGGEVSFWRCANRRAQAQTVASDIERLISREEVEPGSIAVLVPSIVDDGQAVAVALEERAVAHRLVGEAAFFQRAEIRDVLAWLRLLVDPSDAAAVVRALARPPIDLRSVDIARCTQIARRRKLDMVAALAAATESPQVPPEARERIRVFLKLYRSGMAALDTARPDLYVHRLIERIGLRRQQLFAAQADVVQRLRALARFGELAASYVRRSPQATAREFARSIAAVADFGLREQEEPDLVDAGVVQVVPLGSAGGLEATHVYVLGLDAGLVAPAPEPIPDALLHDSLPPDGPSQWEQALRQMLYVALSRASERVVLCFAGEAACSLVEDARVALSEEWEEKEEELFGPAETLHSTYRLLRDELLEATVRTGGRLAELRLDTDLDISHAVVRYLELLKVAALIARPEGQGVSDALRDINARILQAVTAEQKEIFTSSVLDDYLLDAERDARRRAHVIAARDEPSLEPFLPLRGGGVVLSASDIDTYRTCPLKYKFARVFRIPQEPTVHQRFGILLHQVLERFHAAGGSPGTLAELLRLLDSGWRRAGFGDTEEERQLRGKAAAALERYHARFETEEAEPVWFERPFTFKLGAHLLRGRVDRVDRLPGGEYELIDYKTGRPKTSTQLADDVQLSLYAVGAHEAWRLDASRQAYYYLLDDQKVEVAADGDDRSEWVREVATEVAEGIRSQGFEPTPSFAACSVCDYRLVCPAAER